MRPDDSCDRPDVACARGLCAEGVLGIDYDLALFLVPESGLHISVSGLALDAGLEGKRVRITITEVQ